MSADGFDAHRPMLRSLAYRMTGSAAEADDLVQEAWLRWSSADREAIEVPKAWLTTVVTRLCVDRARSARVRREQYVGPWLPEPVRTDGASAWIVREEDRETLSLAFMALLERLSPLERAAYLLHEVFDYEHAEVGAMLGRDERAVRQLVRRAREHVSEAKPRYAPSREQHARVLQAFLVATAAGDVEALARLLADDVTSEADGNGRIGAARKVVHGAAAVAKLWTGIFRLNSGGGFTATPLEANGWPAVLLHNKAGDGTLLVIESDGERVTRLMSVVAAEKVAAVLASVRRE